MTQARSTTEGRPPFAVWAPTPQRVRLSLRDASSLGSSGPAVESIVEMRRESGGWWAPVDPVPVPTGGDIDYGYLIDDSDVPRPDPRSRRQPAGVHQRSRTYDAFARSPR